MPAQSQKQRAAMAIAEHHPEKLNPENKGLLKMSKSSLHDFAATPTKGLPVVAEKEKAVPSPRPRYNFLKKASK